MREGVRKEGPEELINWKKKRRINFTCMVRSFETRPRREGMPARNGGHALERKASAANSGSRSEISSCDVRRCRCTDLGRHHLALIELEESSGHEWDL